MEVVQMWVNRFSWATGTRAWHAYLLAACLCVGLPPGVSTVLMVFACGGLAYLCTWVRIGPTRKASPFMCAWNIGWMVVCAFDGAWLYVCVFGCLLAAELLQCVPPPPPPPTCTRVSASADIAHMYANAYLY